MEWNGNGTGDHVAMILSQDAQPALLPAVTQTLLALSISLPLYFDADVQSLVSVLHRPTEQHWRVLGATVDSSTASTTTAVEHSALTGPATTGSAVSDAPEEQPECTGIHRYSS